MYYLIKPENVNYYEADNLIGMTDMYDVSCVL